MVDNSIMYCQKPFGLQHSISKTKICFAANSEQHSTHVPLWYVCMSSSLEGKKSCRGFCIENIPLFETPTRNMYYLQMSIQWNMYNKKGYLFSILLGKKFYCTMVQNKFWFLFFQKLFSILNAAQKSTICMPMWFVYHHKWIYRRLAGYAWLR